MKFRIVASLVLFGWFEPSTLLGQRGDPAPPSITSASGAVARIRGLFFSQDFVGGADEGTALMRRFPASRELSAWTHANAARADSPDEAIEAGDAMIKAGADDPWGWFVKSIAVQFVSDSWLGPIAIAAGTEAFRRAPTNADAAWARAFALVNNGEAPAAIAFLDSLAAHGPLGPELQTLRGDALFTLGRYAAKRDGAKIDSALAVYARVRAQDPANVTAHISGGDKLVSAGRIAEAYEIAKHAVALSPDARSAHLTYWQTITEQQDRPAAERTREIDADVQALLRRRGNSPIVLYGASTQYGSMGMPERQRELQDRVLRDFSTSASAEWVRFSRVRAIVTTRGANVNVNRDSVRAVQKSALIDFIAGPNHKRRSLLGEAYMYLGGFIDATMPRDSVLLISQGQAKYEQLNPNYSFASNAIRLAEHGYYREAEQIARDGVAAGRKRVDMGRLQYETIGDYARARDAMDAQMIDALGWVYFREGRLADAKQQLDHAYELDPKFTRVLYHLGQTAEANGRLDDAERYYIKGALLPMFGGYGGEARPALAKLYEKRNGSAAGYDRYLARIEQIDRAARKADIEKTWLADAATITPFSLKTLDGRVMAPDSLRGRASVINNWGTWCGPCVAEMAEFQLLAAKYSGDASVRILTINNDKDVGALRQWMNTKGYTFTTLIDDGFVSRAGVNAFPTTWFLDRDGRIRFIKVGTSEHLAEEFAWRVEMLRAGGVRP